MFAELGFERLGDICGGVALGQRFQAGPGVRLFAAFNDKGAHRVRVFVGMADENALLIAAEHQVHLVEQLGGAVPDVFVAAEIDVRHQRWRQLQRFVIDAIRYHHQVVLGFQLRPGRRRRFIADRDAGRHALGAQRLHQGLASHAAQGNAGAHQVGLVVVHELEFFQELRIEPFRLLQIRERIGRMARRASRQHRAPAQHFFRGIFFRDADIPAGLGLFHLTGEEQSCGACADNENVH
ncbi:hypothetical protein D3C87_885000 [compost metagenome]